MAEVLPRHYIMGIVLFTFFIVGGVSLLSMMNDTQSGFTDDPRFDAFNSTFNVMDDVTTEVGDLESGISNTNPDPGIFGVLNGLISSAWNTLQLLFNSFSFMDSVFGGLTTVFGVPAWIPALIGLMITIVLAFAIYSAIFQTKI